MSCPNAPNATPQEREQLQGAHEAILAAAVSATEDERHALTRGPRLALKRSWHLPAASRQSAARGGDVVFNLLGGGCGQVRGAPASDVRSRPVSFDA